MFVRLQDKISLAQLVQPIANGALVLSFFLKPNVFLEGEHAGKELK